MREQLQEIASTISRNKLRTFLTGFSVAWGIFMLIVLLGSGNGLRNAMQDSFGDLAVNSMQVYGGRTSMPYKGFQSGRNITPNLDDIQVLTNEFPDQIDQIAASVYHWGANLAYGREYNTANLYGVTPKFPEIKGVRVTAGQGQGYSHRVRSALAGGHRRSIRRGRRRPHHVRQFHARPDR